MRAGTGIRNSYRRFRAYDVPFRRSWDRRLLREQAAESRPQLLRTTQLTLPDDDDPPPKPPQRRVRATVPSDILGELLSPELNVAFGCVGESTSSVAMPETPVDHDNRLVPWQHHVRLAR